MIYDIAKDLIASNASQSQDNQSHFRQIYLRTPYKDDLVRHNWIYDNPIRLMHHRPKLTH